MIEIRRATLGDLSIIQQLGFELLEYERERFDSSLDPEWPFSEAGLAVYRNAIENRYASLAFVDGEVAGYLIGNVRMPAKGDARKIITANLNNIYVREVARKRGVGRQLFEDFKKYCVESGVHKLNVTVNAGNKGAIDFYNEAGFGPSRMILTQILD